MAGARLPKKKQAHLLVDQDVREGRDFINLKDRDTSLDKDSRSPGSSAIADKCAGLGRGENS